MRVGAPVAFALAFVAFVAFVGWAFSSANGHVAVSTPSSSSPAAATFVEPAIATAAASEWLGPSVAPLASPPDEDATMVRLRAMVDASPSAALSAIADADARYPASKQRDERRVLAMRALVHLEKIGAARTEAEAFYRAFPESAFRLDVERLTGVHPPPPPPW